MTVIKLNGGVGNQLFHYALYCYLKANGVNSKLDCTIYQRKRIHRGLLLPKMLRDFYEIDCIDEAQATAWNTLSLSNRIHIKLFHCFNNHYYETFFRSEEDVLKFSKKMQKLEKDVYLDGFWQRTSMVQNVLPEIRSKMITVDSAVLDDENKRELLNRVRKTNSISIHVRQGDYITNKSANRLYGNICSQVYYASAVDYMRHSVQDPHFFLFSDDTAACEHLFANVDDVETVSPAHADIAYVDQLLMSSCSHHIIANSSFSWWPAALAEKGICIMPYRWNNRDKRNALILPNSIQIDNQGKIRNS